MQKPEIDEAGLVAEMNRLIQTYDDYRGGKVVLVPEGTQPQYASGYNWEGPGGGASFISRAAQEVREKFTLSIAPNNRPVI